MPVRHVLKVNGYGGRQAKGNEKRQCFKGWETLVCKLLIFSHKVVKQWRDYQLFREFSYPELALLEGASGALSISVSTRVLATTPSKRTLKKWNCVGA